MAGKNNNQAKRVPALEWAAALAGLLLVAGMIGYLTMQAIRSEEPTPPLLRVEPISVTQSRSGYVVRVEVSNAAPHTGAAVQIEGRLLDGTRTLETASATLAYVPGQSHRHAGLIFARDPRAHRLELGVSGYEEP